jgi:hypothetical protein
MTLVLLLGVALAGPFEDGLAAWEAGQMDDAIAAWEQPLADGRGSSGLHTNLGVAWYRKGDLPRAIAHWRMARILSPRNSDAVHDLAVARAEIEGPPQPADPLPAWLQLATVGEYGVLGTLLLLVASVGAWVARVRRWSPWPWLGIAVVGALLGLASLEGARRLRTSPGAIVLDEGIALRTEPEAAAPTRRRLPPGTELIVQRRVGDYLLVATGDDQRGWVPEAAVAVVGVDFELPGS